LKVEKSKKIWREIFPAMFFPVRNLKNPKKIRAKVRTAKFFRTKIQIAEKFPGPTRLRTGKDPDNIIQPPSCATSPPRGTGRSAMPPMKRNQTLTRPSRGSDEAPERLPAKEGRGHIANLPKIRP
jgi:hypothetical protein